MKCDKTFNIGAWYYLENNHKVLVFLSRSSFPQLEVNEETGETIQQKRW